MDNAAYLKFVLALAFVLGLAWLVGYAARRFMPGNQIIKRRNTRLLQIVEVQPLDHRTRLMLVRCGKTHHLLTIGPQGVNAVAQNLNLDDIAPDDESTYEERDAWGAR